MYGAAVKSLKDINSPDSLDNHLNHPAKKVMPYHESKGAQSGISKLPQLDITGKRSVS